jgi:hypothetical protein
MLGCSLAPLFSRMLFISSGPILSHEGTVEVGQSRVVLFRFCQLVLYFDVAVLVEYDVIGGQIARFDFVGLKLAAGVDDGEEEVPYLSAIVDTCV